MQAPLLSVSGAPPRLYADWDDAALVEALGRDDERAFAEIYRRYWLKIYQRARYKLASAEVAEEMVQDLFAALWSKRATQAIHKLGPYLYSALRYQVIDFVRTKLVRAHYVAYCQQHALPYDHGTEEALAANDLSGALASSLGQLPASAREVFQLSRFEHQTVPEIALRLDVSPKMVEYHLTKALKILRVALKDFLLSLALLALLN